jgi:putative SOS response-associated peptidase YedK
MCGRFIRTSPAEVIVEEFSVTSTASMDLRPRYNLCPGETVTAIVQRGSDRRLGALRWGLPPRGQINVRSESAANRFGDALRRRRCLIVADGFYEWCTKDSVKIPHFFRLASRRPFGFAALWERTMDTHALPGAAILTCPPNEIVAAVHNRMPVMLTGEVCARWLEAPEHDPTHLYELLRPFPGHQMEAYPVSRLVNSGRNDTSECIRPVGAALRLVPRKPSGPSP